MSHGIKRLGIIVPSLNTIGEDDLRLFCPPDVRYHLHRIRLRKQDGVVTPDSLLRAHLEAAEQAGLLADMAPSAICFNCTGASVAHGARGDEVLAEAMSRQLGLPASNTMLAIKRALHALGARRIVHVCPFADRFASDERAALAASGLEVLKSVGLDFVDAREAARMEPQALADHALRHALPGMDAILLSCANVRAFEAVAALEQQLGVPVVTSNQAVLWDLLGLAGWTGQVPGAGRLFKAAHVGGGPAAG